MELRELPLDDLILDPNLNLRDRLDEFTVERYTEAWGQMPPVTVFEVEGHMLLADGFHRHAAAVQLGRRTVAADVRPGTFADALDHAATVNLAHGLPLSRPERRRAVDIKLRLHHDWSDRRLAETLGVGRELVAKTRRDLVDAGQVPNTPGRIGADGKVYPSAGLPRDPNEHLPKGPPTGQDDPRDRGGRESDPAPWDDTTDPLPASAEAPGSPSPPWLGADAKAVALAEPVTPAAPTIDEMLLMMARQVAEVLTWTRAEGFSDAFQSAGRNARGQFRAAVDALAARSAELREA